MSDAEMCPLLPLPADAKYVTIRQDFLKVCRGDMHYALVLAVLARLTELERKTARARQQRYDVGLKFPISCTVRLIEEWSLGCVKDRKIRLALAFFRDDLKILEVEPGANFEATTKILDYEKVQALASDFKGFVVESIEHPTRRNSGTYAVATAACDAAVENSNGGTYAVDDGGTDAVDGRHLCHRPSALMPSPYKEVKIEDKIEDKREDQNHFSLLPAFFPEPLPETTPLPDNSSQLPSPPSFPPLPPQAAPPTIQDFLILVAKAKSVKTPTTAKQREQIAEGFAAALRKDPVTLEELTAHFDGFAQWAQSKDEKICPTQFLRKGICSWHPPQDAPEPPPLPPAPARAAAIAPCPPSGPPRRNYVAEWNEVCTTVPVIGVERLAYGPHTDEHLATRWQDLAKKVQQARQAGKEWLSIKWLLRQEAGSAKYNWDLFLGELKPAPPPLDFVAMAEETKRRIKQRVAAQAAARQKEMDEQCKRLRS